MIKNLIPVERKNVSFNGAELMAVKCDNEKIYTGVRWICDGLGLSEGQRKGQIYKIQEDVVLSKGGRKIILPTSGGKQEVLCIELEFLPLWLAKINASIINNRELQGRLIDYQLHAKDVLAKAFMKKEPTKNTYNAELKTLEVEARIRNARARQGRILMQAFEVHKEKLSPIAVESFMSNLTEVVAGYPLLPKPKIEKTYTATEIAKELDVSAKKIGEVANANNLKTDEYGVLVLDKSPYSNKQVETFRYNDKGKAKLVELIDSK